MLQADEPDRAAAAHPGYGGAAGGLCGGDGGGVLPQADDEGNYQLVVGDGGYFLDEDDNGGHGGGGFSPEADDEGNYQLVLRDGEYFLEEDDNGGGGGGGFSPEADDEGSFQLVLGDDEYYLEEDDNDGDDDFRINLDQLIKFLDEPNATVSPMVPEDQPGVTPPPYASATPHEAAEDAAANALSPLSPESTPLSFVGIKLDGLRKSLQPISPVIWEDQTGTVRPYASADTQEGAETDTTDVASPSFPPDLAGISWDGLLKYNEPMDTISPPLPKDQPGTVPPYASTGTKEVAETHITDVALPPPRPPASSSSPLPLEDYIMQKHGTTDETGNFMGYFNQTESDMGTASTSDFGQGMHNLSFETDVDTKLSMNFSSVNIRKNGTTGHFIMPEKYDFTFGIHHNFPTNGPHCSSRGNLHDLHHPTPYSTLANILNDKLYDSTDVKPESNGSHLVERYANGLSSSVSFQDASLHSYSKSASREDFFQGVKQVCEPCGSVSSVIKEESVQTVQRESFKAHYPNLSTIDLDDSCTDPLCNQGVTYITSTESSPNHILGETYYGLENDLQSHNTRVDFMLQSNGILPEFSNKHSISGFHMNSFQKNKLVDADGEVHIVKDSGGPFNPSVVVPASSYSKSRSGFSSYDYPEEFPLGSKAHSEKITFQIALQDLNQPMSESSPPDGVLAVPLLRHQRMALSWMVQKETSNQYCSGGILADDQGLGKTVSTIALILSERSPSVKSCVQVAKQVEVETLSSDDEDTPPINGKSRPGKFECKKIKKSMVDNDLALPVQGRPAAGTLVVCPTSVLRQWADEIQNKVTSRGNLSFLVYHGANRAKDPNELAKYDVVITTYSIVSMEVPKQVVDDKDDEEKVKHVSQDSEGTSVSRKRKHPSAKRKKAADNSLIEAFVRPLAKVAWFRVILDEAQTIKNYRTLVARACCGLRAKRRWCLSGTPIQNSIDDLYSYFRFLRYEPYATYSSFCSNIKHPINKNPAVGYQRLQIVLKTVLLRRTKGTFLDGEPIIKLPPKSVELKRLDFSMEERTFYDNLEAESRAQFKAYADAGTVKENYVNILLMLLRLRQACDHPVLVQGSDSSVLPVETVKQLSRDKCLNLLNCLEASQALCTICNDPPEDAVVSICGHVFCNQCVSEHLTGDFKQCPTTHCKVKLNASSIFTKASLKSSIDDLPKVDISIGCCIEKEISEPKTDVFSSDSSKIKAAMDILLSLPILELSAKHISSFDNSDFPCKRNDKAEAVKVNDTCKTFLTKAESGCSCVQECLCGRKTEKALVFSQWTRMLDLLEARLKSSCIQYRRLDGTMSIADRDKAVKDFNTVPEVTVMILSLKAASLGLNLVSACHVLLLDLWWNPTTEDQAVDRAHRIGQTRPVTVMRLTVKDTVEDRILALQEKKRIMVASAFGEDEKGSRQSRLTVDDLEYLFMM